MSLRLIQSGYGDKRDLKAVVPKREEATLDFEARWRMLGRRVHKDEAYTKQDFTYGVHYEGERVSKYNEAPYHSNIIAHPKRCFPYAVEQHMSLPIDRLWETRADFYATVQKNTLKYALEFSGDYKIPKPTFYKLRFSVEKETSEEYRFADFFNQATRIGSGHWVNDGSRVIDMTNSNGFSGIFAGAEELKGFDNYEVEFDFTPQFARGTQGTISTLGNTIKVARSPVTSRPDEIGFVQAPGADDDLIGFIFRARKTADEGTEFYCMLMEGERRIFPGTRAADLTGMSLSDNYITFSSDNPTTSEVPNFLLEDQGNPIVRGAAIQTIGGQTIQETFTHWDRLSKDYKDDKPEDEQVITTPYVPKNPPTELWQKFVTKAGWGLQHKQIYKVTNGVFEKVDVTCLNNTGFLLDRNNSTAMGDGQGRRQTVRITAIEDTIKISVREDSTPNAPFFDAFSFTTDWSEGGVGAMNVSQAVVFDDIRIKKLSVATGEIPKDDWAELEDGELVLTENATEYVKAHEDYKIQMEEAGIELGDEKIVEIIGIDKEGDSSNIVIEKIDGKVTIKTKTTREKYSGRLPESGWYEHDGFINGSYQPEYIHFPNIADALKDYAASKGMEDFKHDSVNGIVENEAFGSVTTDFAFIAISNNAPDAGQEYHEYHYKCGVQNVTPDNYDEATCVNAFEDIEQLTKTEENAFFNKRNDWDESSFSKEYQVTKPVYQEPSPGPPEDALETNPNTDCFIPNPDSPEPDFDECDIDFIFDGKALCMWSCEFPVDIQVKTFVDCVYAYNGETSFDPFSQFEPNKWTFYKVFMDKEFIKEEHDDIRISNDQHFDHIEIGSLLYIETNEHYYSVFEDTVNNGVVTSIDDIVLKVPDFPYNYVDPIFFEPVDENYNLDEVHYLLDAWGNHEDVRIRLVTDSTKLDGTIDVDPEKITIQGLVNYSEYAHIVESGPHKKAVHGREGMPILKVEDKRYQGIDNRFFMEITCVKRETRYKWNSGEMKREASVNGKEPLRGQHKGKKDYGPIDLSSIFIPDDIDRETLSEPIIITDNEHIKYRIEDDQLYFYCDKMFDYEWYSPWVGEYTYHKNILQADTIGLYEVLRMPLPTFYDSLKRHRNVIVDKIELEPSIPFVLLRLSRSMPALIDLINKRDKNEFVSLIAKVKDSYPRVWHPLVQSGYYYIDEKEFYLYSNRRKHISEDARPIKRIHNKLFADGAPILVKHNDVWLRKTQFIKDRNLSHIYEQHENGKGFDKIYFHFSDIDQSTLAISVNGSAIPNTEFEYKGEYVLLSQPLNYGDTATLKYEIEESYFVKMRNLFIDNEKESFQVHLKNSLMKDENKTEIYYEQEGRLPYYKSEIVTNPVLNRHGKGFIYINKNEELIVSKVDIKETKGSIDHEWEEKVSVIVTAYDQYNNPLENEEFDIYVDEILLTTQTTNNSGEIYAVIKPSELEDPIKVEAKHTTKDVESKTTILKKKKINNTNKIIRVNTERTMLSRSLNNRNAYEVRVLTKDLVPLAGELVAVEYRDATGNTIHARLSTNAEGIARSTLNLMSMTGDIIYIEASVENMSGQNSISKTRARLIT